MCVCEGKWVGEVGRVGRLAGAGGSYVQNSIKSPKVKERSKSRIINTKVKLKIAFDNKRTEKLKLNI